MEAPIWTDLHARGVLSAATLTRLDISTQQRDGAAQYLVVAVFATDEGHHLHDHDPRFETWNQRAEAYQVVEPFVFGGTTIATVGPSCGGIVEVLPPEHEARTANRRSTRRIALDGSNRRRKAHRCAGVR